MKKIQITQDLFVKMINIFTAMNLNLVTMSYLNFTGTLKRVLNKNLMLFQDGVITLNIKQRIPTRQKKRQGRNILMQSVCTRILGGNYLNGNVAHSSKTIKNEGIEL